MSNTRIYVASLADYNNGRLVGAWIDANQSAVEIQDEVNAMLKDKAEAGAEEWAIHDFEGFESIKLNEHTNFVTVSVLAELLAEHGKAFAAWYTACDGSHFQTDELSDKFEESYAGEFESLEDYAHQTTQEMGMEIPDHLTYYIDYEKMGRDWELSGDICSVDNGYKSVFIFRQV